MQNKQSVCNLRPNFLQPPYGPVNIAVWLLFSWTGTMTRQEAPPPPFSHGFQIRFLLDFSWYSSSVTDFAAVNMLSWLNMLPSACYIFEIGNEISDFPLACVRSAHKPTKMLLQISEPSTPSLFFSTGVLGAARWGDGGRSSHFWCAPPHKAFQ